MPNILARSDRPLLKEAWFWTAVLFLISLGFPVVFPDAGSAPTIYIGWGFWGLTLLLLLLALYRQFEQRRLTVVGFSLIAAALFLWVAHRNISDRLRPSFVFVVPGVILNGNTWDLIANHRGPKSSQAVQILFIDKDREDYLRSTQRDLSVPDIDSYQVIWTLPEVNPMGHGSIFAQQFVWKPFNLEHSHFSADITWQDGSVHEELEISKVQDKWLYAMSVTDRDTSRTLLSCRDLNFPPSQLLPPCFPILTQPGN